MVKAKLNCWEYCSCERGPSGSKISELGICPAADDFSFNGINDGTNGGRICWAIPGTLCRGEVQGSFAEKRKFCLDCTFFKHLHSEEGTKSSDTKFLSFISKDRKIPALKYTTYKVVKSGERLVTQGEVGDTAYIIQRGSCLVIVEKDGVMHPVDHYGEGDIIGGMGILTGEPHLSHVEAETDMELWALTKEDFERISQKDPTFLQFLTEFVANRLDSRRPTAYRTIGKYVAKNIIGRGGFSIVYKGIHSALNMPVAIKMLRHNLALNDDFLDGFLHEATTIAGMNHENIVRIYDIEERFRTVFIIMELLEGERLLDLLQRLKAIPFPLAVNILLQASHALDYAHKLGVIHRDVTADNIFLLRGNRVKVMDFGLACAVGTEDVNLSGTAAYMSPEQIEGEPVDARTDIYGLGIVTYEMVTGMMPFRGESIQAVFNRQLSHDIPDPAKIVPDLPKELRHFILKASRRDPNRRYQNMGEVLKALGPLGRRMGLTSGPELPEKPKMTSLVLLYRDEHQQALTQLMEKFGKEAKELGIILKISDFHTL